jgi:hypothetical protein
VAQNQVRSFVALSGPILFGTDVGYMREYDPADEDAYLAGAGLSFAQILAALTTIRGVHRSANTSQATATGQN